MLHLALAACVFGNLHRLAGQKGIRLSDARVVVDGGFNAEGTESTGIDCQLVVASDASREKLVAIAQEAFDESSIAAVLRRTTTVGLSEIRAHSTAPAS